MIVSQFLDWWYDKDKSFFIIRKRIKYEKGPCRKNVKTEFIGLDKLLSNIRKVQKIEEREQCTTVYTVWIMYLYTFSINRESAHEALRSVGEICSIKYKRDLQSTVYSICSGTVANKNECVLCHYNYLCSTPVKRSPPTYIRTWGLDPSAFDAAPPWCVPDIPYLLPEILKTYQRSSYRNG